MASNTLAEQTPLPFDLQFVQGDTATFPFWVKGVNWVPDTDPSLSNEPQWVDTTWQAQVRNPYIFNAAYSDNWVPVHGLQYSYWRRRSLVAQFGTSAELAHLTQDVVMPTPTYVIDPAAWAVSVIDRGTSMPSGWYTKVTLTLPSTLSRLLVPGTFYRWDLQTVVPNDTTPAEPIKYTYLRGRMRVLTEWTTS